MNTTYKYIPCFTGDVSGINSALYELGGMIVIHDPSGCNSTYNTHDEVRWDKENSLIFISGLNERDAIFGNDQKLIDDVVKAAAATHPKFIALTSSPIPFLNGTDFKAISRIIENTTGIPTFYIPGNGMHDYCKGAADAFQCYAERMVKRDVKPVSHSLNILGLTPLDFNTGDNVTSLKETIGDHGWTINSTFAYSGGDGLPLNCDNAGAAAVNLVVSAMGLPLAKKLQEMFGTPYYIGLPLPEVASEVFLSMEMLNGTKNTSASLFDGLAHSINEDPVVLIGDPVIMGSFAKGLCDDFIVLNPLETDPYFYNGIFTKVVGEEETETYLSIVSRIIGDPLYEMIANPGARFLKLPHQAFSGRCMWKERKNIFEVKRDDIPWN